MVISSMTLCKDVQGVENIIPELDTRFGYAVEVRERLCISRLGI